MEPFTRCQNMIAACINQTLEKISLDENPHNYVERCDQLFQRYAMTGDIKYLDNIFRRKKCSKENNIIDYSKHTSKKSKCKVLQGIAEVNEQGDKSPNMNAKPYIKQEKSLPTMLPECVQKKLKVIETHREPQDKLSDLILEEPVIDVINLTECHVSRENKSKKMSNTIPIKPNAEPAMTRARTKKMTQELEDHISTAATKGISRKLSKYTKLNKDKNTELLEHESKEATKDCDEKSAKNVHKAPNVVYSLPVENEYVNNETITESKMITPIMIQKFPVVNNSISLHKEPAKDINKSDISTLRNRTIIDVKMDVDQVKSKIIYTKKIATNKGKQTFSQYEVGLVKKGVEAFEKLTTTYKKLNTKPKQKWDKDQNLQREATQKSKSSPEEFTECENQGKVADILRKMDPETPIVGPTNKFNLKPSLAAAKPNRFNNTPEISTMALTSYKASQEEFRERENQRKGKLAEILRKKEAEALGKKEIILQANIDQMKRKREENKIKVKVQRMALEQAERTSVFDKQKQEKEKLKVKLLETQKKLPKMKKNFERKRTNNKQNLPVQFGKDYSSLEKPRPIYTIKKTPLLPTFDCYDSDERETKTRMAEPEWISREKFYESLRTRSYLKQSYVNTLFSLRPHTLNLQEIFENINPAELVRKSSAVWKYEPRFTSMPKIV